MKLFVGIDVSSEKLDVCFLDSSDTTLKEVTLPNNLNGASSIKESVLTFHQSFNYEKIVIGMESTSIYSFHPATFLSEDADLKSLGCVEVVVQNPKSIHRYKGLFEEDKTDRIDAFRIADFLRIERFNKTVLKEERYVALQRLTRSRYQLVHQLTECKQHFLENLYYKCNTLSKELDTSVFGATIVAEIGQIERFENEAQLAKYCGLYWKKNQSGNFESERTPMTRTGNQYLRYYMVEAANSIRRHEESYRLYYQKKYDEVPKFKHKRALVLTARKFVRLVDTLLRNRQLYTPERSV